MTLKGTVEMSWGIYLSEFGTTSIGHIEKGTLSTENIKKGTFFEYWTNQNSRNLVRNIHF